MALYGIRIPSSRTTLPSQRRSPSRQTCCAMNPATTVCLMNGKMAAGALKALTREPPRRRRSRTIRNAKIRNQACSVGSSSERTRRAKRRIRTMKNLSLPQSLRSAHHPSRRHLWSPSPRTHGLSRRGRRATSCRNNPGWLCLLPRRLIRPGRMRPCPRTRLASRFDR